MRNRQKDTISLMPDKRVIKKDLTIFGAKLVDTLLSSVSDGNFGISASTYKTHYDKHTMSKSLILDELLNSDIDNKPINDADRYKYSGFTSNDSVRYFIEEVMISYAANFAKWITDGAKKSQRFDLILPKEDYDYVGVGYVVDSTNNSIKEYATEHLAVVLEPDDLSKFEFKLVTAFPSTTDCKNRIFTGDDISMLIKDTPTYKAASPVRKAYMDRQVSTNKKEYRHAHICIGSKESIVLYVPTNDVVGGKLIVDRNHELEISDSGISLTTIQGKQRNKINTTYTDLYAEEGEKTIQLDDIESRSEFAKRYKGAMKEAIEIQHLIRTNITCEILRINKQMEDDQTLNDEGLEIEKEKSLNKEPNYKK